MTAVPITDQIAEVERELRQRERLYPKWIAEGRIKQDTADAKLRALRAAALSLRFLGDNRDWISTVWKQRRTMEDRDRDEVPDVPEAARRAFDVVQQEFPGAQVVAVRQTEHVR